MRTIEKILAGLALILFGLQFFPHIHNINLVFSLATLLLAVTYFFGGFWLLNHKGRKKKYVIPILAGVAFGTSLIVLPRTIKLHVDEIAQVLPIINIAFFLFISTILLIKRRKGEDPGYLRGIFIRSLIVLIVVGFFAYTPVSFNPYREVLISINKADTALVNNIRMFDFKERFDDAFEEGDCDRAIVFAEKANDAGRLWLGISKKHLANQQKLDAALKNIREDSTGKMADVREVLRELSGNSELWKISGTYISLYKAYKCKGDELYSKSQYELGLQNYVEADKGLNACDHGSEYWELEKAESLNNIALCYKALGNFQKADSLFIKAVEEYRAVRDTVDRRVIEFYTNLASSLSDQGRYGSANSIYNNSIILLSRNSTNDESRRAMVDNYQALISNHIKADSLDEAIVLIEQLLSETEEGNPEYCTTAMLAGVCYYKDSKFVKAESILLECLQCFEKKLESGHQLIGDNHLILGRVRMAMAQYKKAKVHIEEAIDITSKNYGKNSVRKADYARALGDLYKIIGDYNKAEKQYYQIISTYEHELGVRNNKLPEVLSELSDLEIILARYDNAKDHTEKCLSISKEYIDFESPRFTGIINNAAHVYYHLDKISAADSLYKLSLNIHDQYKLKATASKASALNGLGLVMISTKEYNRADSLLNQALQLHKEIFSEHHPLTANVYLNYANLRIRQGVLSEAREMLYKSLKINTDYFDAGHDVFGDINMALAEVAKKEGNLKMAQSFYRKALHIYAEKFEQTHPKVLWAHNSLRASSE